VVVEVGLPPVLLGLVLVRGMDVIERRVVVLVSVRGEQVAPVLSLMQVVRHVEVLVAMHDRLVLVMASRAPLHRQTSSDRSRLRLPDATPRARERTEDPAREKRPGGQDPRRASLPREDRRELLAGVSSVTAIFTAPPHRSSSPRSMSNAETGAAERVRKGHLRCVPL
jgi:hypothetical protein